MEDLYKDILINILSESSVEVIFPDIHGDILGLVEMKCYQTLKKIKAVVEDDSLEDDECFLQIEEIIRELEDIGSGGGLRHNF